MLVLIAEGLSNADIGTRMHLSTGTVKDHVSAILGKLEVDGRVQAALLAERAGLLKEPRGEEGDEPPCGCAHRCWTPPSSPRRSSTSGSRSTSTSHSGCPVPWSPPSPSFCDVMRPLLTFLLTLPAVLVSDAVFAALAALYTLASFTRHRTMLAVCVTVFTICDMTNWPSLSYDFAKTATVITLGYTAATAAAPVFLGQLVQARRDLSRQLAEISEARDHKRLLTAQSVLAKERAQLAREMHDVVSHQVSLIAVRAGALQVGAQDADVKEAAATIRRLSVQTLDELRHMVSVLRASGGRPTELTPQPSLADLHRLVDNSGIETELRTDVPDDLPPTVQRAIYRTVQEALTNARKHAPGTTATVHIRHHDGAVRATVTNTAPTHPRSRFRARTTDWSACASARHSSVAPSPMRPHRGRRLRTVPGAPGRGQAMTGPGGPGARRPYSPRVCG